MARRAIIDAIEEIKGITVPDGADDWDLKRLELDSLDLIEIGMIVEQQLRVTVPTERFDGVQTLNEVVGIFDRALASGPDSQTPPD